MLMLSLLNKVMGKNRRKDLWQVENTSLFSGEQQWKVHTDGRSARPILSCSVGSPGDLHRYPCPGIMPNHLLPKHSPGDSEVEGGERAYNMRVGGSS